MSDNWNGFEQITFDDYFQEQNFKINKHIMLIEMFAGIGAQAKALSNLQHEGVLPHGFTHHRVIEFDKFAIASYNAIHGTDFKTTDIRDIHGNDLGIDDKENNIYLCTYSFPCTDLSVAGTMNGMSKQDWESGKSTRSGLLWEVERILKECEHDKLPDILLMENVTQVHGTKNKKDFDTWCEFLESKGYKNFWKDMNAKDYSGIPQSRNRCFMVSILGNYNYRFPDKVELKTEMKDYLEHDVDDKYYISSDRAKVVVDKYVDGEKHLTDRPTDRPNYQPISRDTSRSQQQLERKNGGLEQEIPKQVESFVQNGLMNLNRIDEIGNKVAKVLMARDYKGFGSGYDTQNGVIKCEKIKR